MPKVDLYEIESLARDHDTGPWISIVLEMCEELRTLRAQEAELVALRKVRDAAEVVAYCSPPEPYASQRIEKLREALTAAEKVQL